MKGSARAAIVLAAGLVVLAGCGDSSSSNDCEAFCDKEAECEGSLPAGCVPLCDGVVEAAAQISSACGDAVSSLLSCASGLTCVEYEAWENEEPPDSYPCRAEDIQCQDECGELCDAELDS